MYQRRIVDDALDELFPALPAVAIEGARGVGKTETARQRAATVLRFDEPRTLEAVQADPEVIVSGPMPVLLDEWQMLPHSWDRVRRAVDDHEGQFLLTGSAEIEPGIRIHSGAGRIVSMRLRPMSLVERGVAEPTVSLADLLRGQTDVSGLSPIRLRDYTDEIWRSGFPGLRDLPDRLRPAQLRSYVDRIVDRELPENGMVVRRPAALRRWLTAFAAATATTAGYAAILDASTAGEADKPERHTVAGYRDHLERVFVLDPLPAWMPAFNPLKRLTAASKHHLVDPALAASLVGVAPEQLLLGEGPAERTGTWLGALFESLATQSVRVYAGALDASVGHLRTANTAHEIDLIVEAPDHTVVAVEVKLAATVDDRDVRHLHWLGEQIGSRLRAKIVLTTGEYAYRRTDGVLVVPLALLGP